MDTSTSPIAALVEMTSGIDPNVNLATIATALAEAASAGAVMAFLPEMSLLLDRDRQRSAAHMTSDADSAWVAQLRDLARQNGIWLHSGSMPLLSDDGEKRVNRSHVIAADGTIRARYDKIHLFDVALPTGESWRESASFAGGRAIEVVDTPLGRLGLTICYDLRFPELYRALADAGAEIMAIPAAFTVSTGEAHWHTLLRARAIETACHVIAPAQAGQHADGRATYGHSLAIDPWGGIIAETVASAERKGGAAYRLICANIDRAATDQARNAIPLAHSRSIRITPLP